MKSASLLAVLAVGVWLSAAATLPAALLSRDWLAPGDGLLTLDTVNQREWLDLTETQLFNFPGNTLEERYERVVSETLHGGMFDDFVTATAADVYGLAESAGINTDTLSFSVNSTPSDYLITFVGFPPTGAVPGNRWATGYLRDGFMSPPLAVIYVPAGRERPQAGVDVVTVDAINSGVWLYRTIPEPASAIIGGAISLLFIAAFRFRQGVHL